MFKCPLCDFEAKSFNGLKIHVVRKHKLNGVCPLCGKKVNKSVLQHLRNMSTKCEKHAILYSLYARSRLCSTRSGRVFISECRDKAIEVLEVVE